MNRLSYPAALVVAVMVIVMACAGGPSREEVDRSYREYQLGVGLWGERNFSGAFQHLLEAVRLDNDNAEAHLMLGHLFLFRRDFAQAERHLQESLRANAAVEARPSLDAEARNSLGVLYIHQERYEDAERELRASATDLMNRTPHLAWGNLGWALTERGELDEAMRVIRQAVEIQRDFCVGWYRMAEVHVARQEFERAEESLARALDVEDPSCLAQQDAWRLRGEVRARLGHREEAVADLERCVELDGETESGRACRRMLEASP